MGWPGRGRGRQWAGMTVVCAGLGLALTWLGLPCPGLGCPWARVDIVCAHSGLRLLWSGLAFVD
jgi:hypothetical protein